MITTNPKTITKKPCNYCNLLYTNFVLKQHENACKLNPINITKLEKRKACLDYVCEQCKINHNGLYGSGKFCSEKCARSFSTKNEQNWIKKFKCTICKAEVIRTKRARCSNKVILCDKCNKLDSDIIKQTLYKLNIYFIECMTCKKLIFKNNKYGLCKQCLGKSDIFRNNLKQSCIGKCGGLRHNSGRGKFGRYNGYWCQSSWELAWIIYNLDHGIKFERNKEGFEYEYNGETHKYYPDFILEDGSYVEIKGYYTRQVEIKLNQFKHNIQIIDKDKIKVFLRYAIDKYGKNFISVYE